jgi:fluoride exporter
MGILLQQFLLVGVGGFLGANARYFVSLWATDRLSAVFNRPLPYGTLVVNVTGSFLIALLLTLVVERVPLSANVRLMLAIGFLGSYTTFSTFAYESVTLLRAEHMLIALGNILLMNVFCLLGVAVGFYLGHR